MQAKQLLLRCYSEREAQGVWVGVCIDLGLAVQGASHREVRIKLEQQIFSYVEDALVGKDREFAGQLLRRKSPWQLVVRYHLIRLRFLYRHMGCSRQLRWSGLVDGLCFS